jgi:glyoxylate reductase
MPQLKPKVIVTRRLPEPVETRMSELFTVTLSQTDNPMTFDQLAEAVANCDVLVPTVTDKIDKRLFHLFG